MIDSKKTLKTTMSPFIFGTKIPKGGKAREIKENNQNESMNERVTEKENNRRSKK
jgi:hypothetical protein